MSSLEERLAHFALHFRAARISAEARDEARKRVLDSLGCFYGAWNENAVKTVRTTFAPLGEGLCGVWGTQKSSFPATSAWINGTGVRALDYNDTYLSKEPCHPSDLLSSFWAACELRQRSDQGRTLLSALILGYDVMCQLCDATSLRTRGWDHVTYLPIASAVGCSYILGLNATQARHAIALAIIGNNAMRQTRVGTISDWKAACAAYAAQAGLSATLLARAGFTGPSEIFTGRHGFFAQVSGAFNLSRSRVGRPWRILDTHIKFFPAEHHAQSAIEAALQLRRHPGLRHAGMTIREITIDIFEVGAAIIGSEKEKWNPRTRETADHSLPYLVAAALLDGELTLAQYRAERYRDADIKKLMSVTKVRHHRPYDQLYPRAMPTRVTLRLRNGAVLRQEIMKPYGYAGRPMSWGDVENKFRRLSAGVLSGPSQNRLIDTIYDLERLPRLTKLAGTMRVSQ